MSIPLPSPFFSPVLSPFSRTPNSDDHDRDHDQPSEHSDSPSRKHERVRSFVKTLASPFASPLSSPAVLPPETGYPFNPITSLSPEPEPAPFPLHKRERVDSVKSTMKNKSSPFPSPFSSPSPASSPFLSPDMSGLSPNPNHSSPEIDPSASPSRKRERVRSFVKNIRRTSSQLFKKDKKDGDAASRKSTSTISTLLSETLSVSTAATTPSIMRRFSHSKQSSTASVATMESDLSASYLEIKLGEGGCIHSPIVEVATPISPAVVQPLDPIPMSPLRETCNEEDMCPEPNSGVPDPLLFPLPPSPPPSPPPIMLSIDPVQPPENPQEVDTLSHDGGNSLPDDSTVSSSSPPVQPPATTDIPLTTPPPDRALSPPDQALPPSVPASPTLPPSSPPVPGSDSDEGEEEMLDLYIPALNAPAMFFPFPNVRLSYFFKPVLTWWLSKDVLSYPCLYS